MKSKQIILLVLFLTTSFIISAQEKYEYMIIEYNQLLKKEINISINGEQFIEEEADFQGQEDFRTNATPLLLKVSEYQDKG